MKEETKGVRILLDCLVADEEWRMDCVLGRS